MTWACFAVAGTAHASHDEESAPRLEVCEYRGVGAGPVLGWSYGHGTHGARLFGGWEISGGCSALRGSVGGSYGMRNSKGGRDIVHYVAYEPGLGAGATAGFSYSAFTGPAAMLGGWAGFGLPVTDELSQKGEYGQISDIILSFTFGVRVRLGKHGRRVDLYIAPKVYYFQYPDFFT